jgi:hypothetical protein
MVATRASAGGGLLVRHGDLCQSEILADVEEGREGPSMTKEGADVGEALVGTVGHVEDESAVGDDFPEGVEVISHLNAMTVLGDGKVALDEVAEPRLKLDGAYLLIPKELGLDSELGAPSSATLGDDFGKVVGEGAENLGHDNVVHPTPIWGGDQSFEMDVSLERELAEGQ